MKRPAPRRPRLPSLLLPALLLGGSALAQSAAPPSPAPQAAPAAAPAGDAPARAQRFYAQVCSRCHETGIGPVITGRGLPPAYYVTVARSGLNAMPAFRLSDIDDATLQALGEYLSATAPKAAPGAPR